MQKAQKQFQKPWSVRNKREVESGRNDHIKTLNKLNSQQILRPIYVERAHCGLVQQVKRGRTLFHIFFLPILSSCSRSGRQKSVKALAKCGQRKASCNREREIHNKSICNQRIESLKIHFYRKGLSFRTHRRLLAIYIHFQSAGGPLIGRFLGPRKKTSLQKSILLEVFLQYKYVFMPTSQCFEYLPV